MVITVEEVDPEAVSIAPSPLYREGEEDEQRFARLMKEGKIAELLIEADYWLAYYTAAEDSGLQPIEKAQALMARAREIDASQESHAGQGSADDRNAPQAGS